MVGPERSECWVSRPSVRFWGFLVALVSLAVSAALSVFFGIDVIRLAAIGTGLVAVVMAIARPYVFRDGER